MTIYTFEAVTMGTGTVSIEAENEREAIAMVERLSKHDALVFNFAQGEGETRVKTTSRQELRADDGTHLMQTPRANAADNAAALEEITD